MPDIPSNHQPPTVFIELVERIRDLLPSGLDGEIGLSKGNGFFPGIAVLDNQVTGIARQHIILNAPLATTAQLNYFHDLTKMAIQGKAAILTRQHCTVSHFSEVFPAEIIKDWCQFSGIPKSDTVRIEMLDILKFLVFRFF